MYLIVDKYRFLKSRKLIFEFYSCIYVFIIFGVVFRESFGDVLRVKFFVGLSDGNLLGLE